ncbi:hypothetical protein MHZ92_19450 [Sporosarcina sp. ACRSL]|uniref:hypothetical protein n=1 Tax=Sporosarcina sp. ACRSL TaxID=2918215 RepID=UPI001EF6C5CC|nr:hypothetical protein [Sporosarcina sp. ACRSL]MCG7346288.1 hypothetical protein [Sporosarcina sp. ACRSL]
MNELYESNVKKAVDNNIAWCQLVSAAHGKESFTTDKVWGLRAVAPPYYPELITSSRVTIEEDIVEFLKLDHVGSIKDSYATLHLEPFGFQMLFEAEWIYSPSVSEKETGPYEWKLVRTKEEFERWTKETGLENSIPTSLLGGPEMRMYFLNCPNGCAGFIANKAADVVGISNVFSRGMDEINLWRTIPHVVSKEYPGVHMVGYEHGDLLSAARSSGWTSMGALRVWIKSR